MLQEAFYRVCRHPCVAGLSALTGVRHFNVPDTSEPEGGMLLVSNHQSFLDPVLVGMSMPRPLHFLARQSLFRSPGFRELIRALGAHPLQRGRMDPAAIRTVLRLLRGGRWLLVFPEGTRTRDGSLGRFRPGSAELAARAGVPVLPVCIEGAHRAWPRHQPLPRPARVAVAYGDPLYPRGRSGEQVMEEAVDQIGAMRGFLQGYCLPWGRRDRPPAMWQPTHGEE
jgi:1-acyl-sn-glycerol-3-phosphate acyltransferase